MTAMSVKQVTTRTRALLNVYHSDSLHQVSHRPQYLATSTKQLIPGFADLGIGNRGAESHDPDLPLNLGGDVAHPGTHHLQDWLWVYEDTHCGETLLMQHTTSIASCGCMITCNRVNPINAFHTTTSRKYVCV